MPSDESASSDKATPPPPPADTHSDSEVCHLEDINQPCENPTCGIHTPAAHTPALSRVVSRANLDAPWTPVEVEEDRDGGIFSSGGGVNNVGSLYLFGDAPFREFV